MRGLACDEVQGYYFSRPVPPAEFAAYVLRRPPSLTIAAVEARDVPIRELRTVTQPALVSAVRYPLVERLHSSARRSEGS